MACDRREGGYRCTSPTSFPDPEIPMVVVSSSGWESQTSGLSLYRFSLILCSIETWRLCTVLGSH